ncbi:rod shape-determining protein MreD [Anaerohalosphaera lusitana]|uniref:Rod shape-determining protein MreD n=1 Tax=Anaerohalosphaera lusitana TaxID=1936003 RepID=A0A1U9NQL7_9BACT|nr:rod shape-determining protein MreD [Anaerohalosphaera lusitana]AQT70115.1 rod shape-determining protein MreD [Anaerohalosphaera lusitana]
MKWIVFIILLITFALLDAGNALNYIALGGTNIRPAMLLILMLFFAINCERHTAILVSFAAGFMADAAGLTVGPHIVAFGIIGYVASTLQRDMVMQSYVRQCFTILIIGAFALAGVRGLMMLKPDLQTASNLTALIGTIIYSAIAGPLVWTVLTWLSPLVGIDRLRSNRI